MHTNKAQLPFVITSALLITALSTSFTATAETEATKINIEPGLWQHNFSIKTESGELERAMQKMEQTLANIPAAQRDMMKKMMASQGVSFDFKNTSVQVCLTQQDIDRGQMPQQEGCKQNVKQTSANSYSFTFSCDTNPPSSGSGVMTLDGRKAYTGNANFTTQLNGKAEQMIMQQSGKWLKADCG